MKQVCVVDEASNSLDMVISRLAMANDSGDKELEVFQEALSVALGELEGNSTAMAKVAQAVHGILKDNLEDIMYLESESDIRALNDYCESNNSKSDLLADITIQDWHLNEIGEAWTGPLEHRDTYRFVIEQSPTTKQVYFKVYPKSLDEANLGTTFNGLSGVIEVRNGRPAISLGVEENDLPIHIESDVKQGVYIHQDDHVQRERRLFSSFDHGMDFDALYYPCGDSSWLMETRSDIANKRFEQYDFGELIVIDDNGWEISDCHWTKTVFFENPDGGASLKGYYELNFGKESTVIVNESGQ